MTDLSTGDAVRISRVRQLAASGEARRIRETAELPIGDLARALGVTRKSVYRWERGLQLPRGAIALRYSKLLDALAVQR